LSLSNINNIANPMDPSKVAINTKQVSSGSHAIVVPTASSELNELQFQVSNPTFFLSDGNLITATLKVPPDSKKTLTRIGLCYEITNTGTSPHCVGIGGPNIFTMMKEICVSINGAKFIQDCDRWSINSITKEKLLTLHGENSIKRFQHHKSEFGQGLIGLDGCFQCAELGAAGSGTETMMCHTFLDRYVELGELPMNSINEIKLEFQVDQTGLFVKGNLVEIGAAMSEIKISNLQIWGQVKTSMGAPQKMPFASHTVAQTKFHRLELQPSQVTALETPNSEYTVNITNSFPKIHLAQKINVYSIDMSADDKGHCRSKIVCGQPELRTNGGTNGCGGGSGNSVTAGKNSNNQHRYMENLKFYESTGTELPDGVEAGAVNEGKAWTLDGLVVAPNTGEKYGKGTIVAAGMTIGENTHELVIKNGDCVLNGQQSLIIEIQYLEMVRLSSGQIAKVQAM